MNDVLDIYSMLEDIEDEYDLDDLGFDYDDADDLNENEIDDAISFIENSYNELEVLTEEEELDDDDDDELYDLELEIDDVLDDLETDFEIDSDGSSIVTIGDDEVFFGFDPLDFDLPIEIDIAGYWAEVQEALAEVREEMTEEQEL